MQAVELRAKSGRSRGEALVGAISSKQEKVIDIFIGKSREKSKSDGLTTEQKAELVLNHRLQAQKLSRSILRKWHVRIDLAEVDSTVDLSLCEAAKHYNPNKGASFITFLFYHLRGNLIRMVEAATALNMVPCVDFDAELSDMESGDSRSVCNAIEVAQALSQQEQLLPDEALYKKELVTVSKEAVARLSEVERAVVEGIYLQGLLVKDIARTLGYSRCHVSRIHKAAMRALSAEVKRQVGYETSAAETANEDE